jgi:uncharacterized protein YjbI with pentapeptide repeats
MSLRGGEKPLRDADPVVEPTDTANRAHVVQQSQQVVRAAVQGAIAAGADLEGADLAGAQCQGALAAGAMLRRAVLTKANLEGADLTDACLDEAVLDRANLSGANLTRATLRGANLSEANLADATVTGADFGGSDCSGAVLPTALGKFDGLLGSVAKPLDGYRSLLLKVTGFVGYTMLTVMTTSDLQLVLNNAQVQLPLLSVGLPIRAFFLGASGLALLLFVYLHVGLHHACRLLTKLPATLPDGLALADKLDLGMLGIPIDPLQKAQRIADASSATPRGRWTKQLKLIFTVDFWRSIGFGVIAWVQLPALTVVLWGRSLANQRDQDAYLLLAIAIAACSCAVAFRRSTLSLFLDAHASRRTTAVWVWLLSSFAAFTWSVTRSSLEGRNRLGVAVAENSDISRRDGSSWHGAYLQGASLKGARLSGSQLGHAHLESAQLQRANLMRTGLEQASMRQSNLGGALLLGANLTGADLHEATLVDAVMNEVDLTDAQLEKATLIRAHLEDGLLAHAKLWRANLSGAFLANAHLEGAVLASADLDGADLSGANLDGADLSGAKLTFVGLERTSLRGAKLYGATLTFARGMSLKQICSTEGWRESLLPDEQGRIAAEVVEITRSGSLRPRAGALCPKP